MIDNRTAAYGALLLRITLGVLFLAHAALKVFVYTPAGAAQFFSSLGLPPALAYLTIGAETAGGLALILGVHARIAAVLLVPILVGSIVSVHGANGFFFDAPKGGWEYPAFWALALAVQAMIGDGAFALLPSRQTSARQVSYA